jgi:hypothetical protein
MIEPPVELAANAKATIDWYRSTPWWRLASQSVVISWRATHILLCAAGICVTNLWLQASHAIFGGALTLRDWTEPTGGMGSLSLDSPGIAPGTVLSVWQMYLELVLQWIQSPSLSGAAECLASMLGIVAIWSLIGGCLTRRSIVELGTRMTAPWDPTIRLVSKRWQSIAWSVSMPFALIFLIGCGPLVLGWISNIPGIGLWIAGLLLIPLLLGSIGIGWCAAISLFGYPLSVCSVVTEKQADAYDGISRAAAYTFQRPLTLGLCVVGMQLLSMVGNTVVTIVFTTGYSVIAAGFQIGSYTSIDQMESMWAPIAQQILPVLIAAFGHSFFWTAASATYLILRKDVDHAEFDLIDLDVPSDPKPLPNLPTKEESEAALSENSAE